MAAFLSKKLGVRRQIALHPYNEMGMDVNKDFQQKLIQNNLLKRKIEHDR